MVTPADTTLSYIRKKVRRLTASAGESTLRTADLDTYINNFYLNNFPYAIKLDQTRSVYTFFTEPNIDKYPIDVNYNMGIREPIYFEGVRGSLFKDRGAFFAMWPRWPTKFNPITGDGVTTAFSFTVSSVPFLRNEFVLGGVDVNGNAISVADDGQGNLQFKYPKPQTSNPAQFIGGATYPPTYPPPYPGMYNQNNGNPGLINPNIQTNDPLAVPYPGGIGTVNYVTGAVEINFPIAPANGQQMTLWVSQYQTGRPYSLLFWNNYFIVRPVPSLIHKVEVETYLTPVEFLATSDNPILRQWANYLSIGTARIILMDRQDMDGVDNLSMMMKEEEGLCLERQAVEEIGQRNSTIFSANQASLGWNQPGGWFGQ